MTKKKTYEEFVSQANIVHNHFYSYKNFSYVNNKIKSLITCPNHGDFEQIPQHHLQGNGCPKCKIEKQTMTYEEFVSKANLVHNNFYSYKNFSYVNNKIKSLITCPNHGDFEQRPNDHLQGIGCPKCSIEKQTMKYQEFVSQANSVHNNFYNYKNFRYVNSGIKSLITCPNHGDFEQRPASHLQGKGCPKCKELKGEKTIRECLKKQNIKFSSQQKFAKCKHKAILKFDFMVKIKEKNGFLCEYNGEQHYIPVKFSKKHRKFEILIGNIKRDNLKFEYCSNFNIPFLIIPYWDIDRIDEILGDVLAGRIPKFSDPPQEVVDNLSQRKKIRDRLGINDPEILCGFFNYS